jgi:hypothetical protein
MISLWGLCLSCEWLLTKDFVFSNTFFNPFKIRDNPKIRPYILKNPLYRIIKDFWYMIWFDSLLVLGSDLVLLYPFGFGFWFWFYNCFLFVLDWLNID